MYCQLGDIAESQPTLAKQVFAIFNTAVQSDKNDSNSLSFFQDINPQEIQNAQVNDLFIESNKLP